MNEKIKSPLFIKEALTTILYSFMLLPILNLLMTINDLAGRPILFTFFILTVVMSILVNKAWLYLLIQTVLYFIFISLLFPPTLQSPLFKQWLTDLWEVGVTQWQTLLRARLTEVPAFLLMTGLFMLMTLLTFLLFHYRQPLPAFFACLVYLLILHTFTSRTILPDLVLLTGTAFLLVALTQLDIGARLQTALLTLMLAFASVILVIGLAYIILDPLKASQEWVETKSNAYQKELDQRGFFDWINSNATGLGFRRTGMSTQTDRLGGRLHQDFSPVFRAYTQRPNYWKVMHRTTYNGYGWDSFEEDDHRTIQIPYSAWENDSLTADQRQDLPQQENISMIRLDWLEDLSYLAYPYGWLELDFDSDEHLSDITLQLDDRSDYFTVQTADGSPRDYILSYDRTFPSRFDEESLRKDDGWREELTAAYKDALESNESVQEMESEVIIGSWFEDELELPASLPQRVTDLALEITADAETEYEIVRAIENYLKEEGGYRYSLLDVETTPLGGDYVDHFLFESRVGYCDNFSSSMTVMLRSLGIPARWTKGFTPGSLIENENNDPYFLVDNSNAHSWPEVFFPSYGWIPFEPSPSFANPVTNQEEVTSIRGETYAFDDEADLLEFEEAEPEPLETDDFERDIEEESATDPADQANTDADEDETQTAADDRRSVGYQAPVFYSLLVLISTAGSIALFRWKLIIWLPNLLIRKQLISKKSAFTLILKLYYTKHKAQGGQTIQMYMNDWKPYVSDRTHTKLDTFSTFADRAYYSSKDNAPPYTDDECVLLIEMLELFPILPNIDAKSSNQF